jgi:hypothetical protein
MRGVLLESQGRTLTNDDQEQCHHEAKNRKQCARKGNELSRTVQSVLRKIVQNLLIFGLRRSEYIIAMVGFYRSTPPGQSLEGP